MWDGSVLCLLLLISYAWVGSCSVLSELTWTLGVGGRPLLLGVGRSADWRQKHCINKSLHFSDTKRSVHTKTHIHTWKRSVNKMCTQNTPTHTHRHMEKKCEQSRHTNTHTEISQVKQARIQMKAMTKSTHKEQSQITLTRPIPTSLFPN